MRPVEAVSPTVTRQNQPPLQILLAVDGSEHTRAALQLLCYLPLSAGSHVIITRMVSPDQKAAPSLNEIPPYLKNMVQTTTESISDNPVQALIELAQAYQTDLIVIGAVGLRKALGFLPDGLAQQVVEAADRPVLVVRAPCRGLRRVLLADRASPFGKAAVNYLTRFPLPARTEIRVMHVLPPRHASVSYPFAIPSGSEGLPPPILTEQAVEAMEEEIAYQESAGKASLEQTVKTLRLTGKAATGILAHGDVATEMMRYSQTQAVDLIVTGSRGLGRVKGWLQGSLTRQLIHSAPCSVLVVRNH